MAGSKPIQFVSSTLVFYYAWPALSTGLECCGRFGFAFLVGICTFENVLGQAITKGPVTKIWLVVIIIIGYSCRLHNYYATSRPKLTRGVYLVGNINSLQVCGLYR